MVLTNFSFDPVFDLPPWVGQRQATFRFAVTNAVTGVEVGAITPLRDSSMTHDTSRAVKRQLTLNLGQADTASINPVQDRVKVYMVLPSGAEYQLGTFMFSASSEVVATSGNLGNFTLSDEMFRIDQPIETGIGRQEGQVTIASCEALLNQALAGRGVTYTIETSGFHSDQGWPLGTTLSNITDDLCITGDWFSPWFDSGNVMRFIRTFDPGTQIPDFDWDAGNQVLRQGIVKTGNLLTVPNRFIVVSNATSAAETVGAVTVQTGSAPIVGTFDVPSTYPYSLANRGFVIPQVDNLAVYDIGQAVATAKAQSIRSGAFEQLTVTTAPDPRHESYNVVWWQEMAWLETAWSMQLVEGGTMTHQLRRAYQ